MSKFYLYKVWFTSAFIIPLLYVVVTSEVLRITVEGISHASLESVAKEIVDLTALLFFFFMYAFAVSLPILTICRIAQLYLVQKTNSEILVRICIILIVTMLLFILFYCISRFSFITTLELTSLFSSSVVLASIYHSFRDRLNSYS
ncbi:hypothetical protein QNI16_33725 [Cytophagaceae bacterium YF14B1]|uniref:Uncharacterized protein n=1 Tax=Xanthocytophaga flava TaxID=3048013 RepID=A0AAE3QZB3_9BACT|nr:hypothetical protein [Xanthocytophaga flavus]